MWFSVGYFNFVDGGESQQPIGVNNTSGACENMWNFEFSKIDENVEMENKKKKRKTTSKARNNTKFRLDYPILSRGFYQQIEKIFHNSKNIISLSLSRKWRKTKKIGKDKEEMYGLCEICGWETKYHYWSDDKYRPNLNWIDRVFATVKLISNWSLLVIEMIIIVIIIIWTNFHSSCFTFFTFGCFSFTQLLFSHLSSMKIKSSNFVCCTHHQHIKWKIQNDMWLVHAREMNERCKLRMWCISRMKRPTNGIWA